MRSLPFLSAVVAIGLTSAVADAALLVEYRFNEVGTQAFSTGSDTTATLEFRNAANTVTDLHGAPGSGVTGGLGLPGSELDRAFDNTASTAMGNAGTGGIAMGGDFASVDTLTSFTISGWFKTESAAAFNGFARLVYKRLNNQGYHLLAGDAAGEFRPAVDAFEAEDLLGWSDTEKWVFFAFTYDGTLSVDNALFYKGYRNAVEAPDGDPSVKLIGTRTINQGRVEDTTEVLSIGNQPARNRPFDGYLDNIRIDGSQLDNSGAISMASLEVRRSLDMIPEPASTGIAVLGGAMLLLRRRRR